jgi:hypothetical protein
MLSIKLISPWFCSLFIYDDKTFFMHVFVHGFTVQSNKYGKISTESQEIFLNTVSAH